MKVAVYYSTYARKEVEVNDRFEALKVIDGVPFENLACELEGILLEKLPEGAQICGVWQEDKENDICLYEN